MSLIIYVNNSVGFTKYYFIGSDTSKSQDQYLKTSVDNGNFDDCQICLLPFFFFSFYGHTCGIWMFPVPRLGVRLELQLPAYATATAIPDPSCVCDLQRLFLNPLNEAGIETVSLQILLRLISTAPQRELPQCNS